MINNYRHRRHWPKVHKKPATQAAVISGLHIITAKSPSKRRTAKAEPTPDPEADARVAAFFERMTKPR